MKCYDCLHKRNQPGNVHIACTNPPKIQERIGPGGSERYELAEKLASENNCVVRCVWPGSGIYPLLYDGNTVFACSNHTKRESDD